jgi:hypothetical protein
VIETFMTEDFSTHFGSLLTTISFSSTVLGLVIGPNALISSQ